MLAFMVDNAKPDFRSKLEQNLLNDQYSSMQEVTDDIKQMLYESGPVKAVFYCPLVGEVTDEEGFSSPVDGRFLKSYAWAVEEALEADTADDEMDNCKSKSEFIEKAVRFYAGYLSTQNAREYLPNVVISTLKSIIAESDNRQNRMMFKLAVEIAIMQNLVALQQDIDPLSLERLRGDCVKEVKRLNGSFSFEDALDWQKD